MNLKKYFNYHRTPGRKFLSVSEFNDKFNLTNDASREAQEHAENSVRRARKQFGPNEHITMNYSPVVAKPAESAESAKSAESAEPAPEVEEVEEVELTAEELDTMLSGEVEQVCDTCDKSKSKCKGHEFENAVNDMDVGDAQTLNHLIAFKMETSDIKTRLMKGKARYIEKLRQYINGDSSVKVRMMNGEQELVSNLNPNLESLKRELDRFPAGPHFIECD